MTHRLALGAALAAVLWLAPTPAGAGSAQVRVAPSTISPDHSTSVTLTGSGFQSIPKGFGGIYVLFGTVSGIWRPSQGGVSGTDFDYVPDSQTRSNAGRQKFVSFPGGSTADEANGGVISASGGWSTTLTIPGARFTAASGNAVNCLEVTCGVITIGAHGVVNADNETFTPVAFAAAAASPTPTRPAAQPTSDAAAQPATHATAQPATQVSPQHSQSAVHSPLVVRSPAVTSTTSSSPGVPVPFASGSLTVRDGLVITGAPRAAPTPTVTAEDKPGGVTAWWLAAPVALLVSGLGLVLARRRNTGTGADPSTEEQL